MMKNLLLEEGDMVQVESASLPVATFAKFQPQSVDFLDITNPKAVYPFQLISTKVESLGRLAIIEYGWSRKGKNALIY